MKKENARKALSATVTGTGTLIGMAVGGPIGGLAGTAVVVYLNDDIVDRIIEMRRKPRVK